MSMGWWGDTWSNFKWVVGGAWRIQREALCIYYITVCCRGNANHNETASE